MLNRTLNQMQDDKGRVVFTIPDPECEGLNLLTCQMPPDWRPTPLAMARVRDALLGALLFPIVIPVLLAASRATATLLDPTVPDLDPAFLWTRFLATLDVIFVVVGLWSFEPVVMGE